MMAKFLLINFAAIDGNDAASELWDKYYDSGSFKRVGAEFDNYVKPSEGFKTVLGDGSVAEGEQTKDLQPVGMDLLEVDSLDDALVVAKGCPILKVGGAVLIHEHQN